MEPQSQDGKESSSMSILISGAGIGGLMTALECRRRGFNVRVFERNQQASTQGDSFSIGPTAINAFKNWPYLQEQNEKLAYNPMVAYCDHIGNYLKGPMEWTKTMSTEVSKDNAPKRTYRHSRPKFHGMLLEQLSRVGVSVEYGKEVVDYFEDAERGGVVLKDGSRHEADLVVAADGVRGASWSLVVGQHVPARSSGQAVYRVAYPVEIAIKDPMIAERFKLTKESRSVTELWIGDGYQTVFWRNEDEMQWSVIRPDNANAEESWSQRTDPAEVVKFTSTIPDWPEVANRVIMATPPERLIDWKLMWRDPQPKSVSPGGRVVQLGDAAHTFLPTSGNGGTQAIEDAVSLAACLQNAGTKEKIPDATRVHNLLRFERVSCLQAFGVLNRQILSSSSKQKEGSGKAKMPHIGKWIIEHDPDAYALDNYNAALAHLQHGEPFRNTNTPPGMVYKPWTIDGLIEAQEKGEPTVLDGDWN